MLSIGYNVHKFLFRQTVSASLQEQRVQIFSTSVKQ